MDGSDLVIDSDSYLESGLESMVFKSSKAIKTVLLMRQQKKNPELVPFQGRCGTIKIPSCVYAVSTELRS